MSTVHNKGGDSSDDESSFEEELYFPTENVDFLSRLPSKVRDFARRFGNEFFQTHSEYDYYDADGDHEKVIRILGNYELDSRRKIFWGLYAGAGALLIATIIVSQLNLMGNNIGYLLLASSGIGIIAGGFIAMYSKSQFSKPPSYDDYYSSIYDNNEKEGNDEEARKSRFKFEDAKSFLILPLIVTAAISLSFLPKILGSIQDTHVLDLIDQMTPYFGVMFGFIVGAISFVISITNVKLQNNECDVDVVRAALLEDEDLIDYEKKNQKKSSIRFNPTVEAALSWGALTITGLTAPTLASEIMEVIDMQTSPVVDLVNQIALTAALMIGLNMVIEFVMQAFRKAAMNSQGMSK